MHKEAVATSLKTKLNILETLKKIVKTNYKWKSGVAERTMKSWSKSFKSLESFSFRVLEISQISASVFRMKQKIVGI
jgi:hypothetical protein